MLEFRNVILFSEGGLLGMRSTRMQTEQNAHGRIPKKIVSQISAGATEKQPEESGANTIVYSYDMERHAWTCMERYCDLANKRASISCIRSPHNVLTTVHARKMSNVRCFFGLLHSLLHSSHSLQEGTPPLRVTSMIDATSDQVFVSVPSLSTRPLVHADTSSRVRDPPKSR